MKTITTALLILTSAFSFSQECKPYKKIKDDFLDQKINLYGAKIGTERSMLLGVSVTSYIFATKQSDSSYTLILNMQYYQKGGDASVNNVHYQTGTSFDIRTRQGTKTYISENVRNKKMKVSSKTLSVCELVVSVSKDDIQYLRDNTLLAYRITPKEGATMQGKVDEAKALKLRKQMACMLDTSITTSTSNTSETTKDVELPKQVAAYQDIQFNIGYTTYDAYTHVLDETGLNHFAAIFSYNGKPTSNFGVGCFFGTTIASKKNDGTGFNEAIYAYSTQRFFGGLKLSYYFLNTNKLQVRASAGAGIGLKRERETQGTSLVLNQNSLALVYDAQLTANYYFSKQLGLTASLGFKTALARVGLSYRF